MEVSIERDQTAPACHGESGEIGIGPASTPHIESTGPCSQQLIEARRLAEHDDLRQDEPSLKCCPSRSTVKDRIPEDFDVGEMPKQSQSSDAAEAKLATSLIVPISTCPRMVHVIGCTQGKPDAGVR
jgi:hypothetical protein